MTTRSDVAAAAAASVRPADGDDICAAVLELVRRIRLALPPPRCTCRPLPNYEGPSYDDPACPLHALTGGAP